MIISEKQIIQLIFIAYAAIEDFTKIGNNDMAKSTVSLINEIANQQSEELKEIT